MEAARTIVLSERPTGVAMHDQQSGVFLGVAVADGFAVRTRENGATVWHVLPLATLVRACDRAAEFYHRK